MNPHKKLTIWTLITNFLIVIVAGHGVGTLGLMEGFIIIEVFNNNSWKPTYESILLILAWATIIIGQVVLIISIFTKLPISTRLTSIGVSYLIVGCLLLLAQFWFEPHIRDSLFTSIPFVILAILLFIKSFGTGIEEQTQSV